MRIIKGKLTIHNGAVQVNAQFTVPLADHNISIPTIVSQKIATEIQVQFEASMILNSGYMKKGLCIVFILFGAFIEVSAQCFFSRVFSAA